jgi:RNA polymerase sigma-70 factor (ECF subfamily)
MSEEPQLPVDEILVLDFQAGSVPALEHLVTRWQKRLWRHAYSLTGDADGAWDVTQEAWLGILRGIGRLDDPAKFPGWAFRIVTNKACDWVRRRRKSRPSESWASQEQSSDNESQRSELASDLNRILHRMPTDMSVVLSLHYLEGFGVAEVARILCIPEGTVKSRLHAARAAFKGLWQPPGETS